MLFGVDILAAVIAGLAGTVVITIMMSLAPQMGMPEMDMPGMLGSMFGAPGSKAMGLVIHFMMGVIFTFIYGLFWANGIGAPAILSGILFGVIHWLVVGLMMGMMPMMHAGIQSGDVPEPGVLMFKNGGLMGFMGGLMGHILFAIIVVLVYPIFG